MTGDDWTAESAIPSKNSLEGQLNIIEKFRLNQRPHNNFWIDRIIFLGFLLHSMCCVTNLEWTIDMTEPCAFPILVPVAMLL